MKNIISSNEDLVQSPAFDNLDKALAMFFSFEAHGQDGLLLITGHDHDRKKLTVVLGEIPEYTALTVKKMYVAGWKQRHLALMFGMTQPRISAAIKSTGATGSAFKC